MKPYALPLFALFLISCLDPLVDDTVADTEAAPTGETHISPAGVEMPGPPVITPAGGVVPSLYDYPVLNAQVDANDGVDRTVPLRNAFSEGETVGYWDFGTASATPGFIWVLGTWDEAGVFHQSEEHPVLLDSIPGDPDYSPLCQVYTVELLPDWNRDQMTSLSALAEAMFVYNGLSTLHPVYVNCPIVHKDVRLDDGEGLPPREPSIAYYRGMQVSYFNLGPAMQYADSVETIPVTDMVVLRREGGEHLSETLRGVDMTGDGDIVDSNNLFMPGVADAGYTPLRRVITAAVPSATSAIDTYQDDTMSDITSATQLFDFTAGGISPISGAVIAYEITDDILYLPIRTQDDSSTPLPVVKPEVPY